MAATEHAQNDDERRLAEMGYKQELDRKMGGFANFAMSFTIISILSGALTLYGTGINYGGPAQTFTPGLTKTMATVTVPPGSYTLLANVKYSQGTIGCSFVAAGTLRQETGYGSSNAELTMLVIGDLTTETSTPIFLRCNAVLGTPYALGAIIATKVGGNILSS